MGMSCEPVDKWINTVQRGLILGGALESRSAVVARFTKRGCDLHVRGHFHFQRGSARVPSQGCALTPFYRVSAPARLQHTEP